MYTFEEHLDNLIRHIDLVRGATILLGKRLIASGRKDFGRLLIAKGFQHDVSKFFGVEFQYLHCGSDVPANELQLAIKQHVQTNSHHPEYHGGVEHMPELALAEMVCDWYARAQEFGTDLRVWIRQEAVDKYKIDIAGHQFALITGFVDILLKDSFRR